ncbi:MULTISPECIES: MarP family serine protease [Brevibacterium]|uniref:MarP family serine protease n=1 Tax=Brevibacterium salitolerans TaxID=1403566 RepID=A0ABP5I848_9MICO|nr:MarP family serine protease [Brevibacterium sp.]
MTVFDIALLVFAALIAAAGWAAGLLAGASTLVGFVVGAVVGRLTGPALADLVTEHGLMSADTSGSLVLGLPVVLGFLAAGIGGWVGTLLRESIRGRVGRGADAVGGALTFVLAFALVVWMGAGLARTTPLLSVNRAVAESAVVSALDRTMPVTSAEALGALSDVLAANGFPQVFSGQPEQIRTAGEPDPAMIEVGREAEEQTVRVTTTATQCPAPQSGSGWALGEELVVTNAHVVAGSTDRIVQIAGRGAPYRAEVVVFDERRDIAVLRVPGLGAEPLDLGEPLQADSDAVLVGFPENGPFTISPARVREPLRARGLDIYDEEDVVREVYALRAVVRHGNSGGPLLDADGRVVGMVFAKSAADDETGYALTLVEMESALAEGRSAAGADGAGEAEAEAVSAGSCASG